MRFKRLCTLLATAPLLAFAESHQYCPADASPGAWNPARDGASLVPYHGTGHGWTSAVVKVSGNVISFDSTANPATSPLAFTGEASTNRISTVFAIVRMASPDGGSLPTLIDAPGHDIRLRRAPLSNPAQWSFETDGATHVSVNGTDSADFTPSQGFQLVEIDFASPVALNDLRIGGAAPRPQWDRNWSGIAELILLANAPAPEQRDALRLYAHRKWRVNVPSTPDGMDAQTLLLGLGLRTGNPFSSSLFIR